MKKFRYLNVEIEYDNEDIFNRPLTIRTFSSAAFGDELGPTGSVMISFHCILSFVAKWARREKIEQIQAMSDRDIVSRI